MRYHDPGLAYGSPLYGPLIEVIGHGRQVILTKDEVAGSGSGMSFKRNGYIALYRVDNVKAEDGVLSFDFVERLEDFK
jgi:hypothetical protein